tara:strand:+ start:133 stop:531 length:399 start_codon:yes stop_codon:yes gene_type:complete
MKEKITIYTNDSCDRCKDLKDTLKKEKIEFMEKNIESHKKEWSKIQSATHISMTPTIFFKGSYFIPERDFQSNEHVVEIFNNYEKPDLDNYDILLERMKTLNFNIAFAFRSLDQILRDVNEKLGENGDKSTS